MSVRYLMAPGFRGIEGGLFSKVTKADVGDGVSALMARGITMLSWADPFYPDPMTPEHVTKAAMAALETGFPCHYTMPIGNPELRRAVAEKLARNNRIQADPSRNILITPGSDSGLFFAMYPFLEPGDEILVPDPSYPNNLQVVRMSGAVCVPVPLKAENGYQPIAAEFERRITEKTKMLVLTNPNNPTGTVFRRENLEQLAALCVKHNLICVVDQAFEDMVYDDIEMVSMATLPGMWERTLSVFSVSKGMALSGYRVGYTVACDEIMDVLYGAAVSVQGATNTTAQLGVLEAFRHPEFIADYTAIFERRRRYFYELMQKTPGVSAPMPESAYLGWINVSRLGSSAEVCEYLLEHAQVSVNDGTAYGAEGAGHIRVVFGCLADNQALYNALERMSKAFTALAKEKGIK